MSSLTNDDYRRMLNAPHMSDEEVDELRADLQAFLNAFLDDYFKGEFEEGEE